MIQCGFTGFDAEETKEGQGQWFFMQMFMFWNIWFSPEVMALPWNPGGILIIISPQKSGRIETNNLVTACFYHNFG